ncbi:dephospho-CoA kinase [Thiocystis violacea]|uniref:dephospho-CoA kinase n=1 Tax=Thiocystis violacea TaxID=13725 RepID=UPI0019048460|nr:dephospho-CoA kinase [Thiocystis violacea]MBK1721127.1 dephospho-CoA kinase [Thiocystis violacea]
MLVIALTGGIGSGKTSVSDQLGKLGAGIIDTDQLSRELTAPGSPILARIADAFGEEVLQTDGALDRARLREQVFQNPVARGRLEAILHPAIKTLMLERLASLATPYAVLVIPLLFETGQQNLADRVLVVDIPEHLQIERVAQRSGLAEAEIRRILASQVSRETRLAGADDVIDNSGDGAALESQVRRLHARYLRLSAP